MVANYYRIEVTASMGFFSTDNPSIYAPLFILKKSFNVKKGKKNRQKQKDSEYKAFKPTLFRAPDYFFRKNRNLSIMNFRLEDMLEKGG